MTTPDPAARGSKGPEGPKPSEAKEIKLDLRWFTAIYHAFTNHIPDYFPIEPDAQGNLKTVDTKSILARVYESLEGLHTGTATEGQTETATDSTGKAEHEKAIERLITHGRETLDEVKSLTEYADQKSTRLLTVATLFVALSGLLLNNFVPGHRLRLVLGGTIDWSQVGVFAVYCLFGLFVLSVVSGALVTFHATQTRFRYRPLSSIGGSNAARSRLFFIDIVATSPKEWAEGFKETPVGPSEPAKSLSIEYAKNYIAESYLIAAKVADKMRYLSAAQKILGFSLKVLFIWFIVIAGVSAFSPGQLREGGPLAEVIKPMDDDNPQKTVAPRTEPTSSAIAQAKAG